MRRKFGVSCIVVEIVAHVGEEGTLWLQLLDYGDRFFQVRMTRVRIVAKGVKNQDVEILKERQADVGNVAHIGEIGGAAEAVAGDLLPPVSNWDAAKARTEELGSCAWCGID